MNSELERQILPIILARLERRDFTQSPGLALAVSVNGNIVATVALGLSDVEACTPILVDTPFHVASVTKQFTAFAIAALVDEGRLSPDDFVSSILPDFPTYASGVKVRHLIHHTSGLREQWDLLLMAGWRLDDVITTDHIWKLITTQNELNFVPGTEMLYCNTGYTILAKIIEVKSQMSFAAYIRDRIAGPLGLKHTCAFVDHEQMIAGRAYSYKDSTVGATLRKASLNFANMGATSLFSTVLDLCAWCNYQNSLYQSGSALARAIHESGTDNGGSQIGYGYGLFLSHEHNKLVAFHDGMDAGFRAATVRIPEDRLSVALLSNAKETPAAEIVFDVVQIMLGEDLRPEKLRRKVPVTSSDLPMRLPDFDVADLQGTYTCGELSTTYYVKAEEGELSLSHSRHPTQLLRYAEGMSFIGPNWIPNLDFFKSRSGQIEGFNVSSTRVRRIQFKRESTAPGPY